MGPKPGGRSLLFLDTQLHAVLSALFKRRERLLAHMAEDHQVVTRSIAADEKYAEVSPRDVVGEVAAFGRRRQGVSSAR